MPRPIREAGFFDLVSWIIFRRLSSLCVMGDSMLPTLASGDRVLVTFNGNSGPSFLQRVWNYLTCTSEASQRRSPSVRVGDVVVCEHPRLQNTRVIKRVGALGLSVRDAKPIMTLYGDNHATGESDQGNGLFGAVRIDLLVGPVVAVVPKARS